MMKLITSVYAAWRSRLPGMHAWVLHLTGNEFCCTGCALLCHLPAVGPRAATGALQSNYLPTKAGMM